MLIEIRKAGFVNKGAELMLHAIIEKVRARYPYAKFVMAPTPICGTQPFHKLASLGFYPKAWLWRYGIQWGGLAHLLPSKIREMYGLILDSQIDVVLDAAGFAYSDQWSINLSRELASSSRKWKKQNTKLIMLPQAFGPFTSKKMKSYVKCFTENADYVFPRERISYQNINDITGHKNNLKIYPDFTNLLKGKLPKEFDKEANRFALVPNYRMIDKTHNNHLYMPFMIECAKYLKSISAKPFVLIHEGENDAILAKKISDAVGGMPIIRETDPLCIKGIIGACDGIISSRYHGLVSALSQGVPALATGWSHKYVELFYDYKFPEGVLSVDDDKSKIIKMIDYITQGDTVISLKEKLKRESERQKDLSKKMWEEVFSIMDTVKK